MLLIYGFKLLGSVYVFYSADGINGWSMMVKLLPSDGSTSELFGWSVSICKSTIFVTAKTNFDMGSAYVFISPDGITAWSETARLFGNGTDNSMFGESISCTDYGSVAIGAPQENTGMASLDSRLMFKFILLRLILCMC